MPKSDQGLNSERYRLVPRTLVFVQQADEILLLKGAAHKRLWANQYNGIGGHVERGEDILSSARRELAEESGLSIEELWLCGVITIDVAAEAGIGVFVFKGVLAKVDLSRKEFAPTQEGTLEWIKISEVYGKPLVEDLYQLLPRVMDWERGDPIFFARYGYYKGQIKVTFAG